MSASDKGKAEAVARAAREALRRLWAVPAAERDRLAPEERRTLEIMQQHDEFVPCWEGADPEEGQPNPFLHVHFHAMLARQLAEGDPPAAGQALGRLMANGASRHEAEHELLRLLIHEIYRGAREGRALDQEAWARQLDRLGAEQDRS